MLLEGTATLQQPLRVRRVAVDLTAIAACLPQALIVCI
jgi:hypothetical protein